MLLDVLEQNLTRLPFRQSQVTPVSKIFGNKWFPLPSIIISVRLK